MAIIAGGFAAPLCATAATSLLNSAATAPQASIRIADVDKRMPLEPATSTAGDDVSGLRDAQPEAWCWCALTREESIFLRQYVGEDDIR